MYLVLLTGPLDAQNLLPNYERLGLRPDAHSSAETGASKPMKTIPTDWGAVLNLRDHWFQNCKLLIA